MFIINVLFIIGGIVSIFMAVSKYGLKRPRMEELIEMVGEGVLRIIFIVVGVVLVLLGVFINFATI